MWFGRDPLSRLGCSSLIISSSCPTISSLVPCLRPFCRRASHPVAAGALVEVVRVILDVVGVVMGGGGVGVGGVLVATVQKGGGGVSVVILYREGGVGQDVVLELEVCLALVLLLCSLADLLSCLLRFCMNSLSPNSVSTEKHSLPVQSSSVNLATIM